MQVCATIAEAREALQERGAAAGRGAHHGRLHAGHLALVRRAKAECKTVVATIYVNPTQFGDARDLEAYPRAVQDDLRVLQREGVDVVFAPSDAEMYPEGFGTWVEPGAIAARLEGEHRPGHFRGVCTVVLKLFNILGADRSYFGQKDAQQALVIRKMAADLGLPVEVVTVPTVRERDGLAMSSRNGNLSREERKAARVLSRALTVALEMAADGELDAAAIRDAMRECIAGEALARHRLRQHRRRGVARGAGHAGGGCAGVAGRPLRADAAHRQRHAVGVGRRAVPPNALPMPFSSLLRRETLARLPPTGWRRRGLSGRQCSGVVARWLHVPSGCLPRGLGRGASTEKVGSCLVVAGEVVSWGGRS